MKRARVSTVTEPGLSEQAERLSKWLAFGPDVDLRTGRNGAKGPAFAAWVLSACAVAVASGGMAYSQSVPEPPYAPPSWECLDPGAAPTLPGLGLPSPYVQPCTGGSFIDYDQQNGVYLWSSERLNAAGTSMEPGEPFASACWGDFFTTARHDSSPPAPIAGMGLSPWTYISGSLAVPGGFALGYDRISSPALGDFLPVGASFEDDTVALLPAGTGGQETSWQGLYRPTLGGHVDLVTGSPVTRRVDLELPFGGATYRMIRTRSLPNGERRAATLPVRGQMWDWAGIGWMANENPILLIDSHVPDMVDATQPPTTYFVIDAHRTIPFQLNVTSGVHPDDYTGEPSGIYSAPPRFRARMSHNGWWGVRDPDGDPSTTDDHYYDWLRRPTQYTVHLYEGQLKYTFAAVWDDVPPNLQYKVDPNCEEPTGNPPNGPHRELR